ncbi:MAG: DMT family transporter [Rhodocyclaceae bacterium]|nr:DMT family transporter [Rhodocyclaceae bacterium]
MSVPAAYICLVLTWSTTPLAVQWSADGVGFSFAVLSRMLVSVALAVALLALWRKPLPFHPRARALYLVSGVSLFVAMSLVYWAAGEVRSGLISVIFGLSPLLTSLIAALWRAEPPPGRRALAGIALAIAGLAAIFVRGDDGADGTAGLLALLLAALVHSASLVMLKRIGGDNPPLATTLGTLLVALPMFALQWWLGDGTLPADPPARAIGAILYLGVFGSLLSFTLYYYVIKHLAASQVALVTLMTPVLALVLGQQVNGEVLDARVWLGSALVLLGLALHQWLALRRLLPIRRRRRVAPEVAASEQAVE